MRKLLVIVGVVLVLLIAAPFVDPTGVLLGKLRGESFFRNRPTSHWLKLLREGNPREQEDAQRALKDGGPEAVPVLTELLNKATGSSGATVRAMSVTLLAEQGKEKKESISAIVGALRDDDPHVRSIAAKSLGEIRATPPEALPILIEMLKTDAKLPASRALSVYRADAREAIEPLQALLKDSAADVRWNAARTLGKIGPDAKSAVPALIETMKDEDAEVREHAAEALGDMGPAAADGVPALIAILTDKNPRVRRDAIRSLGQIGDAARVAIPEVRKYKNDPDDKVREAVVRTLEQLGDKP